MTAWHADQFGELAGLRVRRYAADSLLLENANLVQTRILDNFICA